MADICISPSVIAINDRKHMIADFFEVGFSAERVDVSAKEFDRWRYAPFRAL